MQRAVERFFQLSLLGLVAAGFLAVAGSGFLDMPTVVLVSLGLLLRAASVIGAIRLNLPDLFVTLATLAYIGFFAIDYFFVSRGLLEATVHLVCFLAVMKILTARTDRDYLYTASIALLELVAAAMLSVNLNFFAYLAVYLVCAIAASTSAEIRRGLRKPGSVAPGAVSGIAPRLTGVTAFITAGILLLTVAMFIVLPRSANVAFRHILTPRYHLSGFSHEIALGDIGEIQKDSRAVMHVRPYSQSMPGNLKWRGTALSNFDGHRWTDPAWSTPSQMGREMLPRKSPIELARPAQRSRRDGARFSYRVDLNPSDSDALFVAGSPEFLNLSSGRVIRTATGALRLASVPTETFRYEVSSFLPGAGRPATVDPLLLAEARRYLQLPVLDPRIVALARQLGTAPKMEEYLRTQFGYTLDLPATEARDPLANFLFERRKGHCEYFASAMAVMLRSNGTPARIVNGFQGGTFNPLSGLYIIRASDAHSWVEAWLPGQGWAVFDPTPFAARQAVNPVVAKLALYLDAAETLWQEWVVNYDLNQQITLAEKLQESTQQVSVSWNPQWSWRWVTIYRVPLMVLAAFPFVLLLLRRLLRLARLYTGRATHADASAIYIRLLKVAKARGFEKPAWFTPGEFARSLPPSPLADAIREFTMHFEAFRYGNDASRLKLLPPILNRLEPRGGASRLRLFFLAAVAVAAVRPPDIPFQKHEIDLGASEALAVADVNGDGTPDLISGENWYAGPNWTRQKFRTLNYTQNYVDDFSDLPLDVNGDGNVDVVSCAWFEKKIWWNENPGKGGGEWKEHPIDSGHNVEFAFLVDLNNDGKAQEVLPQFGNAADPLAWFELRGGEFVKHAVSPRSYGHGIGVGDMNGDGRNDILTPKGWLEAPDWTFHPDFDIGQTGFIYALDVNGDGRMDLVTSAAHDYGVFWMERMADGTWKKHVIDDSWSQPHAMTMVDLNGDGKMDFVTGKRYMAHNGRDPGEREPLGLYWYEYFKNGAGEIEWAKHVIDYSTRTGGGMQIVVSDLHAGKVPDIAVAGKSGIYWFENLAGRRKETNTPR